MININNQYQIITTPWILNNKKWVPMLDNDDLDHSSTCVNNHDVSLRWYTPGPRIEYASGFHPAERCGVEPNCNIYNHLNRIFYMEQHDRTSGYLFFPRQTSILYGVSGPHSSVLRLATSDEKPWRTQRMSVADGNNVFLAGRSITIPSLFRNLKILHQVVPTQFLGAPKHDHDKNFY